MDSRFFDTRGRLRAYAVASYVQSPGPVRYGADRRFWCYENGVWGIGEEVVHKRICRALQDDYRPHYAEAVRHVLRAELERIDVDPVPAYINVYNGLIDWNARGGPDLIPHDPLYLTTVQLPIGYHPGTACTDFDAFLAESVAPDDIDRVWEMLGYLMMSGNPLQRAFLLTGGGGNGKGVLLEVIKQMLGQNNCTAVPLHDFSESRFATAELFGRIANVCGDIDATFIENTSRIKEITGEDTVMGERKGQDPFYFKPWCKMIFSANETPGSADSSVGWTRRFEIVNFPNVPTVIDRRLKDRLCKPASLRGIADRAVMALRALMARGTFDHGQAAVDAHARFAERSNKVLQWLHSEDCDYPNPSRWYDRRELLTAFRRWDREDSPSGRTLGSQSFYARMRQLLGDERKRDGFYGFTGVVLTRDIAYGHVITTDDPQDPKEIALGQNCPPEQTRLDLQ